MADDLAAHGAPHALEALTSFLYQAPIGLVQTTLDGEILMINPMSAQLLMPLAPGAGLDNLFEVLKGVAPELPGLAKAFAQPGDLICDGLRLALPWIQKDAPRPTLSLRLLRLDEHTLMASVMDITLMVEREEQRLKTQLWDATHIDSLTLLPSRPVVVERITGALRRSAEDPTQHFAVLYINADRFNHVNVALGQAAGDELLRIMATRLNSTVRANDSVGRPVDVVTQFGGLPGWAEVQQTTGRLSGDEFVVVLEGIAELDDAHRVAKRLVDVLGRPYSINGAGVHCTVSMGVLLGSTLETDADSVLQDASLAMKQAKHHGGGRYAVFSQDMKESAWRRGNLESELRTALASGQLFVVYQPIVDLASGAVVSVEALVRWNHPMRGVVPPIEFIGIAEESGLIGALGEFVLNEACRQFAQWRAELGAAAPAVLSVNLSPGQLVDAAIVEQVRQALSRSGLAAHCLQLEVTESMAAQDAGMQARLHELKALGILLALDDFGTGYSSLACLHQLPIDVVKIDRSFVSQAQTSEHHRVLIEATVRVARSLNMRTVAEGIETEGQASILAGLNCGKGQGYLYAKPLTSVDATAWLRERADSGDAA
jgi:predicted signal transduction protein with EAL and GGDEF domain